jgi:uncharacterized protein (TIGR03086 family)
MEPVAERYRRLSSLMTERIAKVPDDAWSHRTPCEEWDARQLVGHLIDVHGRFQSLVGRSLVEHPDVGSDPLGAFVAVRDQTQSDLDDPDRCSEEYDGLLGRSTFGASVDGFVCFDLIVHGWDLAHATGQDDTIPLGDVEQLQAMVDRMGHLMLENGVIARQLDVGPEATPQQRLLGALGRQS